MAVPKYDLQVFGGLSLRENTTGRSTLAGQRKRLALLAILATEPAAGVPRDRLLALLWSEADEARARNALKQLVYTIRQELGDASVVDDNGTIRLAPSVVASDIQQFRDALANDLLTDAVAAYRGPFLDGVYLRDAPEFERWTDDMRRLLTADYARALERLVESRLTAGDAVDAVRWARVLTGLDPLSTRSAILFIKALDAAGDRGAALRHADVHSALLREELNIDAPRELRDAVNLLRKQAPPAPPPDRETPDIRGGDTHDAENAEVPSSPQQQPKQAHNAHTSMARRLTMAGIALAATAALAWTAVNTTGREPRPARAGALTQVTLGQSAETQPAISPDGRWVAFVATELGAPGMRLPRMRVFVQHVSGGRAVPITSDTSEQQFPAWSPDGTRIAFQNRAGISIVPALGGTPQQLVADAGRGLSLGGWSHDGKRIAFADTLGVWVRDIERGTEHLVTRAGFGTHSPVWSPGDSTLAFVVGTANIMNLAPSTIFIVPARGGAAHQLTDAVHVNTSPAFAADGRSLFFVSNRDGGRDVYQQPLVERGGRTAAATRLTTGANAWSISLSADGQSLVYGAEIMRSNVWSAPIATGAVTPASESRQVTYGDQEVECLSVSRDGAWLLYDSNRAGNQDIYKLALAGGDPIQLTRDRGDDFCGTMSPDGREIAFYSLRGNGQRHLFTMLADGEAQQPVDSGNAEQEWGASWSPDGNRMVFPAARAGARHIYTMSRLSADRWGERRQVSAIGAGAVAWSPDGRHLGVTTDSGLVLLSPDGSDMRVLIPRNQTGRREGFFLAWGRDPSIVFYRTEDAQGIVSFWSVALSGGSPRLLLRLDDALHTSRRPEFATDGQRLFFTLASDDATIWRLALSP